MSHLTIEERQTLNDAMAIIAKHTPAGSAWQFGSARYRGGKELHHFDICYFDTNEGSARGQHSFIRGETFADKVDEVIEIEANAAEQAEVNKALRREKLRAELAQLEQAA